MKRICVLCISLTLGFSGLGQFFPEQSALWCADDFQFSYKDHLNNDQDTLIGAMTYAKVHQYVCINPCSQFLVSDFMPAGTLYVRSAANGRGYIRKALDTAEYLAGDLSAMPGDTVHGVVILGLPNNPWGGGAPPLLYDIVVDSIIQFSMFDVTVTRHFVHEVSFWNSSLSDFDAWDFFWQEGMGTSQGLLLRFPVSLSGNYFLSCAMVGQLPVLNTYITVDVPPWGHPPGGPACCSPWNVGISEHLSERGLASENPSTGFFRLNTTAPIVVDVFDAQGRFITSVRGNEIDLTTQPPGVYTAVVRSASGRTAVRLVVMR